MELSLKYGVEHMDNVQGTRCLSLMCCAKPSVANSCAMFPNSRHLVWNGTRLSVEARDAAHHGWVTSTPKASGCRHHQGTSARS
jgi:hypothetical protein